MRSDNHFKEWASVLEGITRSPMADYLSQLHTLDMTGISALSDQLSSLHSVSDIVMRNQDIISGAFAIPHSQISAIQSAVSQAGTLSGLDGYNRMMENLGSALNMYTSLADQLSIRTDQFSGIMAAAEAFRDRLSFIDSLGLDQTRLTSAVGLALQRVYESEEYELEDIPPLVAECYEPETEREREALQAVTAPTERKERTEKQKEFSAAILTIILFILTPFYNKFADVQLEKVFKSNPPVINQYYIQNITNNLVIEGYDVGNLNGWGYRIVNRDIILRAKPGKSSYVTGRLSKGTIVRVIGKYKKWVEVTWNDDSGEAHFGWIQNYKLSAFSD